MERVGKGQNQPKTTPSHYDLKAIAAGSPVQATGASDAEHDGFKCYFHTAIICRPQ